MSRDSNERINAVGAKSPFAIKSVLPGEAISASNLVVATTLRVENVYLD